MKQLLYIVVFFLPLSILAQIGIGTSTPSAALEIQTKPEGIPALRLKPQSNPIGSITGQIAVIDNILYLYDATRNKWLSVEKTTLEFGRLGNGSAPAEIEFGGGDLQNGPRMPFKGTIVSISISATKDNNNREIGLFINDTNVPNNDIDIDEDGVYTLDPTLLVYRNKNFNLDFNAGDMISLALLDGSVNDIEDLIVMLDIKWRK